MSDSKKAQSKVKPRMVPVVVDSDNPSDVAASASSVPPISIQVIQQVGANLCGVDPAKLSAKNLLLALQEEEIED